jgi:hypothetical protein
MPASTTDTGTWKATTGINYPPDSQRAEAGEKVSGLMPASVRAFLDMGVITPLDATAKKLAAEYVAEQEKAAEAADDEG